MGLPRTPPTRHMKHSDVSPSDGALSVTSTTLLRGARDQDAEAWEELVRVYSRRMYRWCRVSGLQPDDAANIVQEAFAAVARKLPDFRRERPGDTFRGWLRRIVDNKVRDHYRDTNKREDLAAGGTDAHQHLQNMTAVAETPPQESSAAAVSPIQTEQLRQVHEVRDSVGERNWRLFWRVAVDGQSAVDVGREFGVTANTVRIVKMRVLRRLRGQFAAPPPDQPLPDE